MATTATIQLTQYTPLPSHQKVDEIMNDLEVHLANRMREFNNLAREIEVDDDRIAINDCILTELTREVQLVELLHNESIKDVEVAEQRLFGVKQLLKPMEDHLDRDDYTRSIDPGNPNNKRMSTWTDEKRQEMYLLATNVGEQLRGIRDKVAFVIDHINMRNQGYSNDNRNDPIEAITKTLNMQLTSLKWAEQRSDLIEQSVKSLQQKRLVVVQAQQNVSQPSALW